MCGLRDTCAYVCACTWRPKLDLSCLSWLHCTLFIEEAKSCRTQGFSWLAAGLASQFVPRIPYFPPEGRDSRLHHAFPPLTWTLGLQTPVLTFAQHFTTELFLQPLLSDTGSHCVVPAGLELLIFLLQSLECWDHWRTIKPGFFPFHFFKFFLCLFSAEVFENKL